MSIPFEIRALRSHAELAACVEMQRDTWGHEFTEIVPLAILKVAQRIGGVAAGAFDADDRLAGFVFGLTGVEDGRVVHWSDMLAVRPELRNSGLGRALKEWQRDRVREVGGEVVYWTYDPLQAKNAYLNLEKFGVRVAEYEEDMYGATDSVLHRGLGSDRFVVAWDVADDAPPRPRARRDAAAPLLNAEAPAMPRDLERTLAARAPQVRVQVPSDIGAVQARSLEEASAWRACTRAAFVAALAAGYEVRGLHRRDADERADYLLETASTAAPRS